MAKSPAQTVLKNLDLAYGDSMSEEEKTKLARTLFLQILQNFADFAKNINIDRQALMAKVVFEGEDVLEKLIKQGRHIVLITAHYGNWEILPNALAVRFGSFYAVGRQMDFHAFDAIVREGRERFGVRMIEKNGAMRSLVKVLKAKQIVAILVDQNTAESEGVLVNFFGRRARHTPVAAVLARRFDAAIVPAFVHASDDGTKFVISFKQPIEIQKSDSVDEDILKCVQAQANITEQVIRERPHEWFWFHKRWKNQYEGYYDAKRRTIPIPN